MSFFFNGAQANVTVSNTGSLTVPGTGQTLVRATGYGVNTGAAVVTVTAGKTLYITQIVIGHIESGYQACGLTWDGAEKVKVAVAAASSLSIGGGGIIASVAAGTAITYYHTAGAGKGCFLLAGFEQ